MESTQTKNIQSLTLEQRLEAIIFSQRAAIKVSSLLALALLIAVILVCVLLFNRTTDIKYFATSADGRIIRLSPLSAPIESDQAIASFASRTLTDTFTFDYVNYQKQIAEVANSYTADAFTQIKTDLAKNGGVMEEAIKNKWIVTGTLIAAPQVIQKGIEPSSKAYGWRFHIPLMITYQSEEKTSVARYTADVTAIRVDQRNNPRGIEISKLTLIPMN